MPDEFSRSQRVADLIGRELAILIREFIHDAGMSIVTISNTHLSRDLRHAKIYITYLDGEKAAVNIACILNENAASFRHTLSKKLTLRGVPQLTFFCDHDLYAANRLTDLIDSL